MMTLKNYYFFDYYFFDFVIAINIIWMKVNFFRSSSFTILSSLVKKKLRFFPQILKVFTIFVYHANVLLVIHIEHLIYSQSFSRCRSHVNQDHTKTWRPGALCSSPSRGPNLRQTRRTLRDTIREIHRDCRSWKYHQTDVDSGPSVAVANNCPFGFIAWWRCRDGFCLRRVFGRVVYRCSSFSMFSLRNFLRVIHLVGGM